jgi:hypothetical protein
MSRKTDASLSLSVGREVGSVQVTVALLYMLTTVCLLTVISVQSYLAKQVCVCGINSLGFGILSSHLFMMLYRVPKY